jgi:hypothetical protein
MIEPRGRSVLDPRLRGDDGGVLRRYLHVIASTTKQSIVPYGEMWIASLLATTNLSLPLRGKQT